MENEINMEKKSTSKKIFPVLIIIILLIGIFMIVMVPFVPTLDLKIFYIIPGIFFIGLGIFYWRLGHDRLSEIFRKEKPSKLWYLFPIFLGFIGGIYGYFSLLGKDRKMANKLLILGIIISLIPILIVFILIFYPGIFI